MIEESTASSFCNRQRTPISSISAIQLAEKHNAFIGRGTISLRGGKIAYLRATIKSITGLPPMITHDIVDEGGAFLKADQVWFFSGIDPTQFHGIAITLFKEFREQIAIADQNFTQE
jgi:hypothetical protein